MKKSDELARLAGEVFEGAPSWAKWAAKSYTGWLLFDSEPIIGNTSLNWIPSVAGEGAMYCKNQPVTDLPWQETLIKRSDYE